MALKFDLKPIFAAVVPQEAVAFFRQKGYRIGFDYRDVWQQEHQAAFTVAKMMQLDLLEAVRAEVDAAIATGSTMATFRQQLEPLLQAKGWWGRKEVMDPITGEPVLAQLGSPRRLQTIFDTNLATAYSEGQWERVQENTALFPLLMYDGANSERPREEHRAWDGLVLRADDPWWKNHMPVRAWGCKCTVIQLNSRMMEREGYKEGAAPPERYRQMVNKRTGEAMVVPAGVDPAFHYPPGGRRQHLDKALAAKQSKFDSGA